ncbi:retinaldehyde-binding protein 1-like [Photinus pyralis]|uniref:retinaldehyde-binding protein 1-like n=1 Tax=Photinus pyralis TaxID=7054 RepID=UPI0012676BB9|nr:retinaldehyde-binding protein 1-like [Photinus pyralis]
MSEVTFGFSAPEIIQAGHVSDDDLQLLKKWQRETNLPQLTDEQPVLFLIATGSSVELWKATIAAHFRIKTKNPVLFKDRNVQNVDLRKITRVMHFAVMPERYGGSTLCFSGLNDTNYQNLDFECCLRMNCIILEAVLQDNNPQDIIYAFDCRGTTFMHAWKFNMHLLKVYLDYVQHGLPCKIKNIHLLHSNRVMHTTYNITKPWIGQEISSKIVLHSSLESTNRFYEWIPKRYLPKEFGGDLKSIRVYHERTMRKLEELQF